ncbi:hypothetical protein ILUMI_12323 [Ignelater luminosus]|uniref:Ig-like domain-containing protein n=1 Tax=Ignelater luminosus TaxID=2038154 RepID=A0A8K0G6V9_IGNLU|nr:hypothetical protein ILUMI_12323 [Ignelater luminosus]
MTAHFIALYLLASSIGLCTSKMPQIKEIPTDLEAVDGRDASLICKTTGVPHPKITWTHNGKISLPKRFRVLNSGSLHISNLQLEDSGEYTCYAENEFGSTMRSFNFTVRRHTEIMNDLERLAVIAGTKATFHCKVTHDKNLALRVFWLHNRKSINFDEEPRFIKTSDHSLIITKTTKMDSGIYTCHAETSLDETAASGALIVQDVTEPSQLKNIPKEVIGYSKENWKKREYY